MPLDLLPAHRLKLFAERALDPIGSPLNLEVPVETTDRADDTDNEEDFIPDCIGTRGMKRWYLNKALYL